MFVVRAEDCDSSQSVVASGETESPGRYAVGRRWAWSHGPLAWGRICWLGLDQLRPGFQLK